MIKEKIFYKDGKIVANVVHLRFQSKLKLYVHLYVKSYNLVRVCYFSGNQADGWNFRTKF